MTTVTAKGETINVYLFETNQATIALIATRFRLLSSPRKVASCDRVDGARGCPFANEINLVPFCCAISQEGRPQGGSITLGEIRESSPLCQPAIDESSGTINIEALPPDLLLLK